MDKPEQLTKASTTVINGIASVILSGTAWQFYLSKSKDPIFVLLGAGIGCVALLVLGIASIAVAEHYLVALAGGRNIPAWINLSARVLAAIILPCFVYALLHAVSDAFAHNMGAEN